MEAKYSHGGLLAHTGLKMCTRKAVVSTSTSTKLSLRAGIGVDEIARLKPAQAGPSTSQRWEIGNMLAEQTTRHMST